MVFLVLFHLKKNTVFGAKAKQHPVVLYVTSQSYLHQVFSGQKRQANVFHQVSQVFLSDIFIVVDPCDHRLENLQGERQSDETTAC